MFIINLLYLLIDIYTHIYTHIHTHTYTYIHIYIHIYIYTHTHTVHIDTYSQTPSPSLYLEKIISLYFLLNWLMSGHGSSSSHCSIVSLHRLRYKKFFWLYGPCEFRIEMVSLNYIPPTR